MHPSQMELRDREASQYAHAQLDEEDRQRAISTEYTQFMLANDFQVGDCVLFRNTNESEYTWGSERLLPRKTCPLQKAMIIGINENGLDIFISGEPGSKVKVSKEEALRNIHRSIRQ